MLLKLGVILMADCITGTCGCPAPMCPCSCTKTFGPQDLRRVWRVGTSADYPPFEDKDLNDAIVGFDIDLIKVIAQKLRFVVDLHDMDFDSLLPALGVRYIDVVAAAISETSERREFAEFTNPYFSSPMVLLYREADDISDFEDLEGKIVAAQSGTIQEDLLWDIKEGNPPFDFLGPTDIIIYTHTHLPTIVQKMSSSEIVEVRTSPTETVTGIIHATIMIDKGADSYVKSSHEPSHVRLQRTEESFLFESIENCSFALPIGSSLVEIINNILDELLVKGVIDQLIEKWFGAPTIE